MVTVLDGEWKISKKTNWWWLEPWWLDYDLPYPIWEIHGAGIYANISGYIDGTWLPYIAYMDPMGILTDFQSS